MKKLCFLVSIGFSLLITACTKNGGFLDQTQTTNLDEETVFGDSALSQQFLAQIYASAGFSSEPDRFSGRAGLEACCDEAEGPSSTTTTTYAQFATGAVSAYSISTDAWNIPYSEIRAVNQFLQHLPTIPFNDGLKRRTRGEALFLRAWYYSVMLEHYGGVPLIGDTVYGVSDKVNIVRNTFEECVNYITAQCDSAFQYVFLSYNAQDYGRATKGACLALKAKVLLYAASPLFNGGQIATAEPLRSITGYPAFEASRWQKAADAAKAVIDLNVYALSNDTTKPSVGFYGISGMGFYNLFQKRVNSEYIFQRMQPENYELEGLWRPPSKGGSNTTGSWPYQTLADAFQMNNGKNITDPTSGYNPDNPYLNREPRFYHTFTYNGDTLLREVATTSYVPIFTYVGAPFGDGFGIGTPTGYYGNKMCRINVLANLFTTTPRCFPLMRLADIYLMYAEALNEAKGPGAEVYKYVDSVRYRAGIIPLPDGLSTPAMRQAIQHERQVELSFEGKRFFDVRRWKIAEETQRKTMTGMKITFNAAAGTYSYQVADVRDHSFRPAMYLWPIPQSETAKSADLLQNPEY